MDYKEYNNKIFRKAIESSVVVGILIVSIVFSIPYLNNILYVNKVSNLQAKINNKYSYADISKLSFNNAFNNEQVLGLNTVNRDAKSLPVINYHGIVNEIKDVEDVNWDNFANQLKSLKFAGYKTVSLKDAEEFLNGNKTLPDKSFLLTFDDGRKDSYYPVDKVLKELDFRAVMYVINERTQNTESFHLNESEIIEMLKSGRWEIGSHSDMAHKSIPIDSFGKTGHWLSNKMWISSENRLETEDEYRNRIVSDLKKSKSELERKFNTEVNTFAIPYGDFGQENTNYYESKSVILSESSKIYKFILYQPWGELGFRNYPVNDNFMIRRYTVHSTNTPNELTELFESSNDKEIPYAYLQSESKNNWVSTWGKLDTMNGALNLKASSTTTGAAIYLNGSELWSNLRIDAKVKFEEATDTISLTILGNRYGDNAYCNFSRTGVGIYERYKGLQIKRNVWHRNLPANISLPVKLSVIYDGKNISCLVNDFVMASDKLRYIDYNHGIVGIGNWSSKGNGYANTTISEFKASSIN